MTLILGEKKFSSLVDPIFWETIWNQNAGKSVPRLIDEFTVKNHQFTKQGVVALVLNPSTGELRQKNLAFEDSMS